MVVLNFKTLHTVIQLYLVLSVFLSICLNCLRLELLLLIRLPFDIALFICECIHVYLNASVEVSFVEVFR